MLISYKIFNVFDEVVCRVLSVVASELGFCWVLLGLTSFVTPPTYTHT